MVNIPSPLCCAPELSPTAHYGGRAISAWSLVAPPCIGTTTGITYCSTTSGTNGTWATGIAGGGGGTLASSGSKYQSESHTELASSLALLPSHELSPASYSYPTNIAPTHPSLSSTHCAWLAAPQGLLNCSSLSILMSFVWVSTLALSGGKGGHQSRSCANNAVAPVEQEDLCCGAISILMPKTRVKER